MAKQKPGLRGQLTPKQKTRLLHAGRIGGVIVLSALLFYTLNQKDPESPSKPIAKVKVLKVVDPLEVSMEELDIHKEVLNLDQHLHSLQNQKNKSSDELFQQSMEETASELLHNKEDLLLRIHLHENDPKFPREAFMRRLEDVSEEIEFVQENIISLKKTP
ncbi:MAG: hypothetical protein AAFY71_21120 [Bacteroidota bacterium]